MGMGNSPPPRLALMAKQDESCVRIKTHTTRTTHFFFFSLLTSSLFLFFLFLLRGRASFALMVRARWESIGPSRIPFFVYFIYFIFYFLFFIGR
ncbi:hypothetical protein B0F90DRAFT_1396699 [Multifurca ochricompacta]|uniref:Transmembrane protein n=1 Tax=Multifurca ochricompacta TaxID=376703 RepID=A0AAD4LX44_9AGAM|nr:hypothetical protein B0F90DRAFT_1396699 [Multifurca ochricompacta]